MSKAEDYNRREFEAGRIKYEHLDVLMDTEAWHGGGDDEPHHAEWYVGFDQLVHAFQLEKDLHADGMLGPKTRATLVAPKKAALDVGLAPILIHDHWMGSKHVTQMPIDGTFYYAHTVMEPRGVVCHYSVTGPGSAKTMAKNRQTQRTSQRKTSWHVSIEPTGEIVQMVPFDRGAWHARPTAEGNALFGSQPNRCSIGIELISRDGSYFPPEQVEAYARVLRALVRAYPIKRELAMVPHSSIHPTHQDPGPVWMTEHAQRVVQYAFADLSQ